MNVFMYLCMNLCMYMHTFESGCAIKTYPQKYVNLLKTVIG